MKKAIFITAALFLLTGCGDEEGKEKKVEAGEEVVTEVSQPENTESKEIKPDTKSIEGETDDGKVITAYHWHDIEAMPKAETILEAVETIYGKDRYYYEDTKTKIDLMKHIFEPDNEKRGFNYEIDGKEEVVFFNNQFNFDLVIDNNVDMRMEMIDFFHYLKESNLILTEEQLRDKGLERQFTYQIRLFNERLPGENYSQPSIYWMVKASSLLEMDFSNKEGIYKKIYNFGQYEGPYPSVDEQNQE